MAQITQACLDAEYAKACGQPRKGRSFQRVNEFRKPADEPPEDAYAYHKRQIMGAVRGTLHEIFGLQGMQALELNDPTFFLDLEASIHEAYVAGYYDGELKMHHKRGQEATAAVGRMLSGLVHSMATGEDEATTTLRVFAANAGEEVEAALDAKLAAKKGGKA